MALVLSGLAATAAGAATTATAWMDHWWDDDAGLLLNPAGAYEDAAAAPGSVHMVRESAWYAVGLLLRDGAGDTARAARALEAVAATQYDLPGHVADGTFRRFAADPVPGPEAVEWVDYDPNWRQFVGTSFALVLERAGERLAAPTRRKLRDAIARAVAGDPPDRVHPAYSNIALMRAWLDGWAAATFGDRDTGERASALARATVERFDRHGTFDEYNSPTYYGIDLFALALWRAHPVAPGMDEEGARIEAALWSDVAAFYHAGLRNLCGPYDRAYGMAMDAYVANLSLWLWIAAGRDAAPLPALDGTVVHGHDLCKTPVLAAVGAAVPDDARRHLTRFRGERTVRRQVPGRPTRTVTAWLAGACMAGGMESGGARRGWSQYHPATVHWRTPDGAVAWLRVRHDGPIDAWADTGLLTVRAAPGTGGPGAPTVFEASVPAQVAGCTWRLPGLTVECETDGEADAEDHAGAGTGAFETCFPSTGTPREWRLHLVPGNGRGTSE